MAGVVGCPVIPAVCRVWISEREPTVGDPVGAAQGDPVVVDAAAVGRGSGRHEGCALQAGVGRVGPQPHAAVDDVVTDPGAAARTREHRLAVVRVAGACAPVGVDHQVGDRAGGQDRVVATRGQVEASLAPAEPGGEVGGHRGGVHVREVAGGAAHPGAVGELGVLAGAGVVAGRLDVAEPKPGGGAEIGRRDLVGDEPVEDATAPRPPGRTPRRAVRRRPRRPGSRSHRGRRPSRTRRHRGPARHGPRPGPRARPLRRPSRRGRRPAPGTRRCH